MSLRENKRYPDNKQLQITGLIHDLGKILFEFNEPSRSVVGDTYIEAYHLVSSSIHVEPPAPPDVSNSSP